MTNKLTGFDDPRGRQSEELAVSAEQAEGNGRLDEAHRKFAEAAALEEAVVADVSPAEPRVRAVLAISAVALWLKARRLPRALALARHYIAIGASSENELADLLTRIRSASSHHSPMTLPHHSEAARQYSEAREQLELERTIGRFSDVARKELDQMWSTLGEADLQTIAEELMLLEAVDRTGEFLCVDVGLDRIAEVGPRAAMP